MIYLVESSFLYTMEDRNEIIAFKGKLTQGKNGRFYRDMIQIFLELSPIWVELPLLLRILQIPQLFIIINRSIRVFDFLSISDLWNTHKSGNKKEEENHGMKIITREEEVS